MKSQAYLPDSWQAFTTKSSVCERTNSRIIHFFRERSLLLFTVTLSRSPSHSHVARLLPNWHIATRSLRSQPKNKPSVGALRAFLPLRAAPVDGPAHEAALNGPCCVCSGQRRLRAKRWCVFGTCRAHPPASHLRCPRSALVPVRPGLSAALCEGQTAPERDTKEKNNVINQQQPQQQQHAAQ